VSARHSRVVRVDPATPERAARHSRSTASSIDSPARGKWRGRFHWPTSSKTAPLATCHGWIGVVRIGSARAPRSRAASCAKLTGTVGGRKVGTPTAPTSWPRIAAAIALVTTPDVRPWSIPVPIVV